MIIDVYSVVCPSCFTGERRVERALRERTDLEAQVRWRPFRLQPGMTKGGLAWSEFARQRFGNEANGKAAFAHVAGAGEPEGVRFDFDRVASAPKSEESHRLILFAVHRCLQWETADALFCACFTEGWDLNDRKQLVALASGARLDVGEARGTWRMGTVRTKYWRVRRQRGGSV
jgi:predicted DsbA family dithiol-disulfide isomerase